ncbi:GRC3 protein [Sodiomyces alkalinus F11]|uniref:Polynucleotide 5'-hydroxyl-kinase GRC3 n=1 Tax=Sodiomyces alkalinus (strain CBS 110278 / VKM F-3762 / F11) TaxID=1314773 RepID=A0A3N2PMM4_SODAK|nr:GRC3 protein [Sodiomyces alkalinus F11]ROT35775.1 GRC3 protein [Sodiomyces alkalinus F11]
MASPKRRKIETGDTQPMSAFALRRQLPSGANSAFGSPKSPQGSSRPAGSKPVASSGSETVKSGNGAARLPLDPSPEPVIPAPPKDLAHCCHSVLDSSVTSVSADAPAVQPFSTFKLTKQNSRKLSGGILRLKLVESERFVVLGSFGVRVINGEVTVAGALLRPSESIAWIHASHSYAIPVLRCSDETSLELHPHPNAAELRGLEKLSPLFRGLWNESPAAARNGRHIEPFQLISTSKDAPKKAFIQDLVSPPAWNKKLAELVTGQESKCPVVLICGPKSSGKSTFGRILCNRLLTSPSRRSRRGLSPAVAILDLDPGQPEYHPAGTIGLVHVKRPNLSPPFTHPVPAEADATVLRSHAVASVSPASDPELYIECALDLFRHYQQSALRGRPLIINTPGWVFGTGLDLLTELVSKLAPTDVIYMSEDGPSETVEALKGTAKNAFVTLPSQQSEFTTRTALHLRAMQAMTYFHSVRSRSGDVSWTPEPLTAMPPLQVRYSGESPGILGILSYELQPPAGLLAETVNGSILAIVEIEDAKAFRDLFHTIQGPPPSSSDGAMDVDEDDEDDEGKRLALTAALETQLARTPEGIPFIPNPDSRSLDPRYSRSLGLVLLRGIDVASRSLQVLTPVPLSLIEESRSNGHHLVLVHGKFDTPGWAYTEDAYARSFTEGANEEGTVEIAEGDTDSDDSADEPENLEDAGDFTGTPWVEELRGNEKRPVGSRVWRVRRDLGKAGPGGGD